MGFKRYDGTPIDIPKHIHTPQDTISDPDNDFSAFVDINYMIVPYYSCYIPIVYNSILQKAVFYTDTDNAFSIGDE